MKRLILITLVITLIPACSPSEPDFRKAYWGMTQDEIIALEGKPETQMDHFISYDVDLFGIDVYCRFDFTDGKFTSASYTPHIQSDLTKEELYEIFDQELERRYGPGENFYDKEAGKMKVRFHNNTKIQHTLRDDPDFPVVIFYGNKAVLEKIRADWEAKNKGKGL